MNFIYLSKRKIFQLLYLSRFNRNIPQAFEKIGNDYGFMIVPKGLLDQNSTVLSFGVGEDIDAEVDLIKKYHCNIHLYDPTDISVKHVAKVKNELTGSNQKNIADKILFHAAALWKEVGSVRFFKPKEENFVSHSINNIDASAQYVEVPAVTIKSILGNIPASKADYIKMDIEGAEYEVLDNMLKDRIDFKAIYLEYHYNSNFSIYKNIKNIYNSLMELTKLNYKVIYCSRFRYFCLIK